MDAKDTNPLAMIPFGGAPTGKLAEALARAQASLHAAEKDGFNPHFKSKYASLTAVWAACREPLSQNGLSVVQIFRPGDGGWEIVTKLLHASGESIESVLPVPMGDGKPQAIGSAISYMRRYALAALVGVVADDDDAEAANIPQAPPVPKPPPKPSAKRNPATAIIEALAPKPNAPSEPISIADLLPFEATGSVVVPSGQFKGVRLADKPRSEWAVYTKMLGEKIDSGKLLQEDHAGAIELKQLIDNYLKK